MPLAASAGGAHREAVRKRSDADGSTLTRLVEQTPPDRDRFVDFLRAASIVAVMLGHWMVSVVLRDGDEFTATNVLASARWLHWGTWLVQVMPLFFFVGGFSNLRAESHGSTTGLGYRDYLRRRLRRLMRPTLVFVVVWLAVAAVLDATSLDPELVGLAGSLAAQPLWFLAVYLLVVALAPPLAALHRRRPIVPLLALVAAVVALDVGRFAWDLSGLAMANYLLVFLFAQQLGFFYGDGTLTRMRSTTLLTISATALGMLVVLTATGPYPVSMVGVPGEAVSNMSPPTLCILVLTVAQVGIVMALRPAANRWLRHRRAWTVTVAVNARIMTLFLWHLTALVLAAVVLVLLLGLPTPAGATTGWWLSRPLWVATAACILAVFVAAFGWAEQPRDSRDAGGSNVVVAVLGVVLVVRGLIGLALDGFSDMLRIPDRGFLGLALSPIMNLILIGVGYVLVEGITAIRSRPAARSARR